MANEQRAVARSTEYDGYMGSVDEGTRHITRNGDAWFYGGRMKCRLFDMV